MLVLLQRRRLWRQRLHFRCLLDRRERFVTLLQFLRSSDGVFFQLRQIVRRFQVKTRALWRPRLMRTILLPLLADQELRRPCRIHRDTIRRWDC